MSTLQALQQLSDGMFHRLADDLVCRLEPRYRRLRTHGLNQAGASIVGNPDSYVGDSAAHCSIAFCYTVQRKQWGKKTVDDVKAAVAASPSIGEIVVALPRDVDREANTSGAANWLELARTAARPARLRIIDGKEIARLLDGEYDDLRHAHLGIPYSRRSQASLLASARAATEAVIDSLQASGRYDRGRYVARSADRELYWHWQQSLRRGENAGRTSRVRLIALVNDSGLGKTSLMCAFTQSLGGVLPVVLADARNLSFSASDVLVTHAIHALQGVLDPALRAGEEAAIIRHLAASAPLTLVVDGLDETHTPSAVRIAITHWLRSDLAKHAVLIVTSRREFWRQCADPAWAGWMARRGDDRSPLTPAQRSNLAHHDPVDGLRIPDRFTSNELEEAWRQAGRDPSDLYVLSEDAREELRHAFTLRVYLDVCQTGASAPAVSRTRLLETWLNSRLEHEAVRENSITPYEFERALRKIAEKTSQQQGGVVAVGDLADLSRFDAVNPPGPVVGRLIHAGILEVVPKRNGIRFVVEAVEDFYRADADLEEIRANAAQCAASFAERSFTEAHTRLTRIGSRIAQEDCRHEFVEHLCGASPEMSAVVMASAPTAYDASLRTRVVNALAAMLRSPHRVRGALAIDLLSTLHCQEARDALTQSVLPPADPHQYHKAKAAMAFIALGHAPAAPFVFRSAQLGIARGNDTYYYRDSVAALRQSTRELREALAESALPKLATASGDAQHVRACYVLACLADDRLVEHLEQRLCSNGLLHAYENHALVATGTDAAGHVFAQSILAVGERIAQLPRDERSNDARNELLGPVILHSADIRFLAGPAFIRHLRPLIEHQDIDVSWIAGDFVKRGHILELMYDVAVASLRIKNIAELPMDHFRAAVTSEYWTTWWKRTDDLAVRRRLLNLAPRCPSADLEDILLDCLEVPELRGKAARLLGEYGCARSASRLRQLLAMPEEGTPVFAKAPLARALAELRDDASVPTLKTIAALPNDGYTQDVAIASLGIIGSTGAEQALCDLLAQDCRNNHVITALVASGSPTAVAAVLGHVQTKPEAARYLCEAMRHMVFMRGHRRGEYYTHVHCGPLVSFIEAAGVQEWLEDAWRGLRVFEMIDGPEVRRLFRKWLTQRGAGSDPVIRVQDHLRLSDMCVHELTDRGDEAAIPHVLDQRADASDDTYVIVAADRLEHFPSESVAAEIALRLRRAESDSVIIRMLALLGRFGGPAHGALAESFLNHGNDLVRNIACETLLRLTDPMRVPEAWREM